MFRMHRASFWLLSDVLQQAGGAGYWDGRLPGKGQRTQRPLYQQIAVTLYMLGGAGRDMQTSGINLNIGKGTVSLYMGRTVYLLVQLLPVYIRWPNEHDRHRLDPPTTIFR